MEFPSLNDDNSVVDEKLVDETISRDMTGTKMARTETNEEDEQLPTQHVRRSSHIQTFLKKYDEFKTGSSSGNYSHCEFNFSVDCEPTCFQEATSHDQWKDAMQKEYDALIKNGQWRLVGPLIGIKPIGCKWIYKTKYKADGSLDKHKERLVAKGYAQKEGIDYTETFAPTTKWGTIRSLFAIAAQKEWKIHHMDVKIAFLNGDLKEDAYMFQPEGFSVKGKEQKVCKLMKSLYGLKQVP